MQNSNKDGAGYEQQLVKSGQNMKGTAKKVSNTVVDTRYLVAGVAWT